MQQNTQLSTGKLSKRSKIIVIIAFSFAFLYIGIILLLPDTNTKGQRELTKNNQTYNSEWDGSVREVKDYLKKNLRDPDSYQSIEWGKVILLSYGTYEVRHKYRAKNGFGGYDIEEKLFIIQDKKVIKVVDWNK